MTARFTDLFSGDPADPLARARWPRNDLGAAMRLLAIHSGALKAVHRIGWAAWDGRRFDGSHGEALALRFAADLQAAVLNEAAAVKRRPPTPEEIAKAEFALAQAGSDGDPEAAAKKAIRAEAQALKAWAKKLGDAGPLKAALSLAAVQPGVMVDPADMDARALVITCANGRLDLGRLPPADAQAVEAEEMESALSPFCRDDLSTRCTRAAYRPGAPAPRWEATLRMFVPDDAERAYLQRCVGYALQGGQEEQVVFFWIGRGANGKSTILDALAYALGDYMAGAPVEAFLKEQRSSAGHTTELIRLIGARAVRVSEPEPGAVISDSRIKTWTGGEDVAVRELREKGFEARFDGTLFFSANATPQIHSTDDGFWRRFQVQRWREQITRDDPRRRPKHVVDAELRSEAEGILAWAVEGWRQYALRGLDPPASIRAEGQEMRAAIDSLGACLTECFDLDPRKSVDWAPLYAVVKGWHEAGGMKAPSAKALALRLSERGFDSATEGREKRKVRLGLALKTGEDRPAGVDTWLS